MSTDNAASISACVLGVLIGVVGIWLVRKAVINPAWGAAFGIWIVVGTYVGSLIIAWWFSLPPR